MGKGASIIIYIFLHPVPHDFTLTHSELLHLYKILHVTVR